MRSRTFVVLSFCLVFLFVYSASAQTFRGSIQGTVTDTTGAAIRGAQVKVFSPGTGLSRKVITNDLGGYAASELPLGIYSVTVEKDGFGTTTLTNITVSVGATARADAKLATGMVQEVVEVNADVPLVETTTNTTGATIEATEAAELPVNGRDYTKLLELVPGATSDPVGSTESAGSYGLFSLNGNRGRSNNFLLDGTDMNDGYRNLPSINEAGVWGAPATILPVDALAEIPVTGSPEAEFGRSSGATVNIVTKSGTNAFHGSVFEYFRNGSLSARNYFNTVAQTKNSFTNHQFGGLLDGPIVKDASFFTLAYEGQRENGGQPQLGTVPTQADIVANTPAGGINPVIQSLLTSKPWGALPQSGDGSETFTTPFDNNSDNVIAKVDQHLKLFSPGDLLTGRYFYSHGTQHFPLGMLYTGSSAPGYNTLTPTHVNVVSLSYTSIPRPNLIVEVRGGYNRLLQQFLPQDMGLNPDTTFGLNTLPPGYSTRDLGLPTINVYGANGEYSPVGATSSDSRGRIDTNYQIFTNVSLTKGRHNFKAGVEWRRTFINSFIDSGHRGKLVFDTLGDFLAGMPNGSSSVSAEGDGTRYSYQNGGGVYLLDSWRMSSKITFNYGLRWDYFGVIGAKNNAFSLFNVKTDSMETVGATGGPASLYPKSWDNFAPRLSVVDDLLGNGKLVIRASGGIFYDGPSQDFFVGNQAYNTYAAQSGPAFNNIGIAYPTGAALDSSSPVFGTYTPNSGFTVDQNLVTPRYGSYNLNIESQLAKHVAVEIGYVGSQGRHLYRFRDLNQINIVNGSVDQCGNGQTITYGNQCFPTYTVGSFTNVPLYYMNQIETSAISNYNSLQGTLKLQNWHNLTSTLNYTWAHSIDTASDGMDFVPNASQPEDSWNPHADRADSNFDVRHRVQWYWTYNVPKVHTAQKILNGWAVDGMFNFAAGQPYTVSYLEGGYNGSGEGFGRPDIIGDPHAGASGTNLLNMAAFAAPCTVDTDTTSATYGSCINGHPGTEGRNSFRSPNYTNFDFSLTKTSHITEKVAVELRCDFFNIFNHPNFSNPLLPGFGIDAFGSPITAGNRLVAGTSSQFLSTTATPDVGSGNPYLGGGGPRGIQLAAHLTF
ncbi:MAG: carboxypeptidase regulatory-like domain-containing protein [Terracidiphilus sp.]|nr:carboxypeptidase regulatory-like domain-containing protein [Terracidiphilus sp.]